VKLAVAILSCLLPWSLRRRILARFAGYELHPDSRIGLSLVVPREKLVLEEGARIGHLNVIWNIDRLHLGKEAWIGQLNWISAIRVGDNPTFDEYPDRRSELVIGDCAAITVRHYLDCTDSIRLEPFALVGGVRSTLMAHHMNVQRGRQGCGPIHVGRYSMVSTNCVLLGGAVLPHHSILGARSLLIKDAGPAYRLYVGSPASPVKEYQEDLGWFQRKTRRTF
jgi:serine acetyltransferase